MLIMCLCPVCVQCYIQVQCTYTYMLSTLFHCPVEHIANIPVTGRLCVHLVSIPVLLYYIHVDTICVYILVHGTWLLGKYSEISEQWTLVGTGLLSIAERVPCIVRL